jgi:hypothetical protein
VTPFRPDHLEFAKTIQAGIRNRPKGQTAMAAMAFWLQVFEGATFEKAAQAVDLLAEQERLKGAGMMLRQRRGGDDAPTEADVNLYVTRYNFARTIAAGIRAAGGTAVMQKQELKP